MRAERWLPLVALVGATACAADFSAALLVTVDGPALSAGGGYWVDVRQPDGSAIDGVERQFVAFASGAQEFTAVLENDESLGGNDSRLVRLVVDAVPQRDAPALARGAVLTEVDRGEVADVTLELIDDPRPFDAAVVATFDGGTVTVDPSGLPSDERFVFDLWVDAGEPVWVARLGNGNVSLDTTNHRDVIGANGLRLVVTAEPADSPEPLVRSSGWPVLRGKMDSALVELLVTAPGAELGILAAMASLLDTAEAHRQLALNAFGSDAEVMMHCEHVFATLGGTDVAEDTSAGDMRGDFDDSGDIMYPNDDHTGIGLGTTAAPGYLKLLSDRLSALEATHSVGNATTCANNLRAANIAALDATEELATHPNDNTRAGEFDAAVTRVRGDPWDSNAVGTSTDQTFRCVVAELQALADFELVSVAAGTN